MGLFCKYFDLDRDMLDFLIVCYLYILILKNLYKYKFRNICYCWYVVCLFDDSYWYDVKFKLLLKYLYVDVFFFIGVD